MTKNDDINERFHGLDKKQAVEEARRDRDKWWIKKLLTMCLVMWSGVVYVGREIGGFLYGNYDTVRIGIDAAISAWRARNG